MMQKDAMGGVSLAALHRHSCTHHPPEPAPRIPASACPPWQVMDTFWKEAPEDAEGRAEHAGRALLFLQQ